MSDRAGSDDEVASLVAGVRKGERRALARAITLAESTKPAHRAEADALLEALLAESGGATRIGITGVPGVGKSTFIEAFGLYLIDQGHKVAVLAVDPTSQRSGGSILGDKTRMQELSRRAEAFIRPSPTGGTLGGVARRSREAMLLCEAGGFDVVIVETVGVGQSETAVAGMVDLFVLLLQPGGGDELQGIKRGIVELADLLLVNKADGELEAAARRAVADYQSALRMLRPGRAAWRPQVLSCSALEACGMAEIWQAVQAFREALGPEGLAAQRAEQAKAWLWREVDEGLVAAFKRDPRVAGLLPELEAAVAADRLAPSAAARRLLETFLGGPSPKN